MTALLQTAHQLGIDLVGMGPLGEWVTFLDRWGGYVRVEEKGLSGEYAVAAERLQGPFPFLFPSPDKAIRTGRGDGLELGL
jgi:hypothetical protein